VVLVYATIYTICTSLGMLPTICCVLYVWYVPLYTGIYHIGSLYMISPKIYTWSKTPLMLDPYIYFCIYIIPMALYYCMRTLVCLYICLYTIYIDYCFVLLHCNNTMSKAPMRPLIVWYASYLSIYYIYLTGRSCRLFIRSLSSKIKPCKWFATRRFE